MLVSNEVKEWSEVEKSWLVMMNHENEESCEPDSRLYEGKDRLYL